MTRFCLVRHGQTDWNVEGRYTGQSDIPLNAAGRQQARQLAGLLKGEPFAAVYASDLMRARETAEIIAGCLQLPVRTDPRLREINQGEWEGLHVDTIKARYAALWQQRASDPSSARAPAGETVGEVAERVSAALDEIARGCPEGSILIVAHGLSLATVLCRARNAPIQQVYQLIPDNTTPVWVTWEGR